MSTTAAVGTGGGIDPKRAGRSAAEKAQAELPNGKADFAIVFSSSIPHTKQLVEGVADVLGDTPFVGCTGEGIVVPGATVEGEPSVGVMAISSDQAKFDAMYVEGFGTDSVKAARDLAEQVNGKGRDEPKLLILLPDGLSGNCTAFLDELDARLSVPVALAGGAAADDMAFESCDQFVGNNVFSGGVAAVLVSGDIDVEVAASHGCVPVGDERTVTKFDAEGWMHTIDNEPAWDALRAYLSDGGEKGLNADGIVHLCFGTPLRQDQAEGYDDLIIRTPLQLNEETGALLFPGGGLKAGQKIQVTRRDPGKIAESAKACASRIRDSHPGKKPALVLQFDCAGRGRVLFGACASDEIVRPLQEAIGQTTPWIGFHTFGEIARLAKHPYYHNYTVVLCAIYDK